MSSGHQSRGRPNLSPPSPLRRALHPPVISIEDGVDTSMPVGPIFLQGRVICPMGYLVATICYTVLFSRWKVGGNG